MRALTVYEKDGKLSLFKGQGKVKRRVIVTGPVNMHHLISDILPALRNKTGYVKTISREGELKIVKH